MDKTLRRTIEEAIAKAYEEWGREKNKLQIKRKAKNIAQNMVEAYEQEQKRMRSIFGINSCDDIS
ncbi:MAG: hypothetical protein UT05_C0007G0003 [Parcubacteria group bacterium GW2011_GWF2_38_76]|nr:MAG: hypothetical protein UT05_C0007G0003 [Parcubacteria group bacterium GW2011_GWF2_38_76]HBM46121.1 hypothetical protein [Patescibacteria group bacterium]